MVHNYCDSWRTGIPAPILPELRIVSITMLVYLQSHQVRRSWAQYYRTAWATTWGSWPRSWARCGGIQPGDRPGEECAVPGVCCSRRTRRNGVQQDLGVPPVGVNGIVLLSTATNRLLRDNRLFLRKEALAHYTKSDGIGFVLSLYPW